MNPSRIASFIVGVALLTIITDNWLELGLCFMTPTHGVRALKDMMGRQILAAFDAGGIGIASATYDIVGFPALRQAILSAPEST